MRVSKKRMQGGRLPRKSAEQEGAFFKKDRQSLGDQSELLPMPFKLSLAKIRKNNERCSRLPRIEEMCEPDPSLPCVQTNASPHAAACVPPPMAPDKFLYASPPARNAHGPFFIA